MSIASLPLRLYDVPAQAGTVPVSSQVVQGLADVGQQIRCRIIWFDEEFAGPTRRLFADLESGRAIGVSSTLVQDELQNAPAQVQHLIASGSAVAWELVTETGAPIELARAYIRARIVPVRFRDDCPHVAIPVVSDVDDLVSWNLRHILQYERIRGFNVVNLLHGYNLLEVRSPLELIYHGECV